MDRDAYDPYAQPALHWERPDTVPKALGLGFSQQQLQQMWNKAGDGAGFYSLGSQPWDGPKFANNSRTWEDGDDNRENDFYLTQNTDGSFGVVPIQRHGWNAEFARLALPIVTAGAAGIVGAGAGAAAGAGSAATSTAGNVAANTAANSVGSAIGQSLGLSGQMGNVVGNALYGGMSSLGTGQNPFHAMLMGGMGGVAQGISNGAGKFVGDAFGKTAGAAAQGMVNNAIKQGVGGLLGGKFDPRGLLTAGVTSGIGAGVGQMSNPMWGQVAGQLAGGLLNRGRPPQQMQRPMQRPQYPQQRPTMGIPRQGLLGPGRG